MKLETIKNKYNKLFVYYFCEEDWCQDTNKLVNNFFNNKYNENIKFYTTNNGSDCMCLPCLKLFYEGDLVSEVNCVNRTSFTKYLEQHYLNAEALKKID